MVSSKRCASIVSLLCCLLGSSYAHVPIAHAQASTRTFNSPWEIRSFINSIPGITHIKATDPGSGAARNQQATAEGICELAGFDTAVRLAGQSYSSCGDNTVAYWDANKVNPTSPLGKGDFVIQNACSFNNVLSRLRCEDPIIPTPQCSDTLDNDSDGGIDALIENAGTPTTQTFSWNGANARHDIDLFVNSFTNIADCPRGTNNFGHMHADQTTANSICVLKMGTGAVATSYTTKGWSSCGDNTVCYLNGNNLSVAAACSSNAWINTLTCSITKSLTQCNDGLDNDNDGQIDFPADTGCVSAQDNHEIRHDLDCSDPNDDDESGPPPPQCNDGVDNDSDSLTDFPADPGCTSATDTDETDPVNLGECSDSIDNDSDGATDWPNDFSCDSPADSDESDPLSECQDGVDNDSDGLIDYPADPECGSNQDTREAVFSTCSDGVDNDGDGLIDLDRDPGCFTETDPSEFNTFKCSDGLDNDNDGQTDYPNDPECRSAIDGSETTILNQCEDTVDNNGDGLIDFPADPNCNSRQDHSEAS